MDQPLRRIQDEESYNKIQSLIDKMKEILGDEEDDGEPYVGKAVEKVHLPMPKFTLKLDDPAGNSFIEFLGSMADAKWNLRTYPRTLEQNVALGLVAADDQQVVDSEAKKVQTTQDLAESQPIGEEEILIFPGVCSSCGHPLNTYMKRVNIPYFKVRGYLRGFDSDLSSSQDILIMSTNCDRCGYRDNEVKSGAAISAQGKRITLKVEDREDLSRDILKVHFLESIFPL